jgi:hypothetical protein
VILKIQRWLMIGMTAYFAVVTLVDLKGGILGVLLSLWALFLFCKDD